MKRKFLILFLITLFLISCAKFFPKKTIETPTSPAFFTRSFDKVWNASLKALLDIDFTIIKQKKESAGLPAYKKWSGVIEAKAKKKMLLEKNYPLLSITVKDVGGKIEVQCQPAKKSYAKYQNSFFEYLKIRVNE